MTLFDYQTVVWTRHTPVGQVIEMLDWCIETFGAIEKNCWRYSNEEINISSRQGLDVVIFEFTEAKYKTLFELRWANEFRLFENKRQATASYRRWHREYLKAVNKVLRGQAPAGDLSQILEQK